MVSAFRYSMFRVLLIHTPTLSSQKCAMAHSIYLSMRLDTSYVTWYFGSTKAMSKMDFILDRRIYPEYFS